MKRSIRGLSREQVESSRRRYGNNILTPTRKESIWKRFLEKFKDPLIIILIIAGILSLGISVYEHLGLGSSWNVFFEPAGILLAILLSTTLAFIFELKSDKEFSLLNQVDDEEPVVVVREGRRTRIPKKDVVVGDIVVLESGCEVPADALLLTSTNLHVDESSLTGEPVCHKSEDPAQASPDATYPSDRVYRGTKVMEGHGICEVSSVGDSTEYGKVYRQAQIDNGVKTPLNEQLESLGSWISRISYALALLILVGRAVVFFRDLDGAPLQWLDFLSYMLQSVMIAVTLIVVAVPEGLPMAVTLSLAYSMRKMLATNNLVRKMHACETMGAATVICTDKTGTLTCNEISVSNAWVADDIDIELLYDSIAINSTASVEDNGGRREVIGNPTEGAMLRWLWDRGIDYHAIRSGADVVEELPFSTENKYMATVVRREDGRLLLLVKGAPEIVFGWCGDREDVHILESHALEYEQRGMRLLALAVKYLEPGEGAVFGGKLRTAGLKPISLFAMSDPVREDVPSAVRECLDAGIDVKIVTGDNPTTAAEIGRQIGIWSDSCPGDGIITGPELSAMTEEELSERAGGLKIIARARPSDKEKLVRALQARGEVVAVTGDGTNDAPALNAAHVGLSMGDGTSVAKEASDITILDNSFASIGRAVLWGRTLYRNIQRFILFQMTVNIAACLIVLCGAFMGVQSPLTVTQMLWINLIMDTFAAMALASLPPERELMKNKPRDRKTFIIDGKLMRRITIVGGIFCVLMVALTYVIEHTDIRPGIAGVPPLGKYDGITAYESGLFFTAFIFLQFWNLFNAKAYGTDRSAWDMRGCRGFLIIIALIFLGQIAILYLGEQFFNVERLELDDLFKIIVATSTVMWIGEGIRAVRRKRAPSARSAIHPEA